MIQFKSFKNRALLCMISLVLFSCTKPNTPPSPIDNGFDRGAMLKNIADEIILPSYANFKVKLDTMSSKGSAFTAAPSEMSLLAFRQAWVEAYIEWQKVELFDVGPASDYTLRYYFNIYPARITKTTDGKLGIEDNINNDLANLDLPDAYPTQGFPALDYLINGLSGTDSGILTYYTSDSLATKRLTYINKLTQRMNDKFANIYSLWTTSYRNTFISKTGMDVSSSVSLLVNGYVLNYERYIRSGKFGIPSGVMLGGTISPDKVEAYYKGDLSLTLAKTAHQASVDLFNGKSVLSGTKGPSLRTYLVALGAKDSNTGTSLAEIINTQFALINSKLALLTENLSGEVTNNNQAMIAVFDEMQTLVRLLKVDMVSAMSVTITYVDMDGD